jgi:uncharacterized NAD-dependent epimerase/dehydratase family protein
LSIVFQNIFWLILSPFLLLSLISEEHFIPALPPRTKPLSDGCGGGADYAFLPTPVDDESAASVSTAIVYCEANFGEIDGKTANGLVRHSEKYQILAIIDSQKAGSDAGVVLDGEPNGIPICRDLTEALLIAREVPGFFIFGAAPASGVLSVAERELLLEAMSLGMSLVNGLHEFLNDDLEFAAASEANNVTIMDIRKPRPKSDLRMFTGRIDEVTCPRIAVLGTDGAIGKRTTATILAQALNERGVKTILVGTGQTGLIQGAKYGVALDAIPAQFCSGEMEAAVLAAFKEERPDAIIIEGQGALSHPAFLTSAFILRGSRPDAVILQHAPGREVLSDYPSVPMPTPVSEINLIRTFIDTQVIGMTINHENMSNDEVNDAISMYEGGLGIPVTDALTRPSGLLVDMVTAEFPGLRQRLAVDAL